MFDSPVLEAGIGMVLVYFVLALIASGATDLIRRIVNFRAKTLRRGLEALLGTGTLELYRGIRTRIFGSRDQGKDSQNYIPSRSLAMALIAEVEEREGSAVGPAGNGTCVLLLADAGWRVSAGDDGRSAVCEAPSRRGAGLFGRAGHEMGCGRVRVRASERSRGGAE